jgi:uncharacterized protein (TIRG00374 family)
LQRKHIDNLLKILLAAALVAFVLSNVDWQDHYRVVRLEGGQTIVSQDVAGTLQGSWDAESVEFLPEGAEQSIVLHPGTETEAGKVEIRPGLPTYVRQMNIGLFVLGALGFFIGVLIGSVRWLWLLGVNQLGVSWPQAFRLTWIGIFFNNVVPGLTGGDLVKAFYIARLTGKKTRPILTVIVDRIMGLVALAVLTAIVLFWKLDDPQFRLIAYGVWAGLALLLMGSTAVLSRRLRRLLRVDLILRRLPGSKLMMSIDESLYLYRNHLPGLFFWMGASVLNHVVMVGGIFFLGEALGLGVPPLLYLILVPIIQIASAVPLAPAGWGVGDWLFGTLFEKFASPSIAGTVSNAEAVMRTRAIALSLVYRIHIMLWSLLGALFLAFQKGRASQEEMSHLMDDLDEEKNSSSDESETRPQG